MEDKLVTLAIHTFEKAQILKTLLETEGITEADLNELQTLLDNKRAELRSR